MKVTKFLKQPVKASLSLAFMGMLLFSNNITNAKVDINTGRRQREDCKTNQPWGRESNPFITNGRADAFFKKAPSRWAAKYPPRHNAPNAYYGQISSKSVRYMLIDKTQNHVWFYVEGRVIYDAPMADNTNITPVGTLYANRCVKMNGNLPNFIGLDTNPNGSGGKFSGIGVHSIPISRGGKQIYPTSYLGKGIRTTAGCINVDRNTSSFAFNFLTPGTPVVITP
jgi:hypothetical protein